MIFKAETQKMRTKSYSGFSGRRVFQAERIAHAKDLSKESLRHVKKKLKYERRLI